MEYLKSFITNLNHNFTNILNQFKKPSFSDHYAKLLELDGYYAIKYTNNIILLPSRDINYWFEIEYYDYGIHIRFCNNSRYIGIYYKRYNYDVRSDYNLNTEKSSILQLNKENNNWNKLVSRFKIYYCDINWHNNFLVSNHEHKYRYRYKHQYILSIISSLKNICMTELILYFDKNLISIIINYLLEN